MRFCNNYFVSNSDVYRRHLQSLSQIIVLRAVTIDRRLIKMTNPYLHCIRDSMRNFDVNGYGCRRRCFFLCLLPSNAQGKLKMDNGLFAEMCRCVCISQQQKV